MSKKVDIINREHWLTELVHSLETLLQDAGHKMPKFRITCSFPVGRGRPSKTGRVTLGECWYPEKSADGTSEILVSPVRDEPLDIAATVLHEMCHAVLPSAAGHKAPFARLAKAVGLEGKPTSTEAGDALTVKLKQICDELGPYPHAALDASGGKKQGTRLLKSLCPTCGYTVRVTYKWIDEAGHPICPACHTEFVEPDSEEIAENPLELSEQSVEYKFKGSERFAIRMIKRSTIVKWVVTDYGADLGYFADASPRVISAESREHAVNVIEAVKEGLYTLEDLEDTQDDEDIDLDAIQEDAEKDWQELQEEPEDEEIADHPDSILTPEEEAEYQDNQTKRESWVKA